MVDNCARGARSLLRSDYEIKLTANACIALCSSTNAVSISSACTIKRFPSPRCASTIQIVRPLESIAETQPQLQPAFTIQRALASTHRMTN